MEVVDNFFLYNLEDFDKKIHKIVDSCKAHNARAYIRLNRRNLKKTGMMTLKKVTDLIISEDYKAIKNAYLSAAGEYNSEPRKKWIVDIDTKDVLYKNCVSNAVYELLKEADGGQIFGEIPTKAGYHIICNPFNVQKFRRLNFKEDIHKDNPTLLYAPFS